MAHWVACHGCGAPAPNKGGWCSNCDGPAKARKTWRWAQYARSVVAAAAECGVCGATERLELDHIKPITQGGSMWDPVNHRVLCKSCNAGQAHN